MIVKKSINSLRYLLASTLIFISVSAYATLPTINHIDVVATSASEHSSTVADNEPMIKAEVMPTFQGGDITTFLNWVYMNMTYPEQAMKDKIEGRVIVEFVVDQRGKITDVNSIEMPEATLGAAVEKLLKKAPKWTPGINAGEPVKVRYTIPVIFKVPIAFEAAQLDSLPKYGDGGIADFKKWLDSEIEYPKQPFKQRVQGVVKVEFVVESDGFIIDVKAVKSPAAHLTDEVKAVILSSVRWMPGMKDGLPVRTKYEYSYLFKRSALLE